MTRIFRNLSRLTITFALLDFALAGINVWCGIKTHNYDSIINFAVAIFALVVGIQLLRSDYYWNTRPSPTLIPIQALPPMQSGTAFALNNRWPNTGAPPYGVIVPETDTVEAGEIIAWRAWFTEGRSLYSTYVGCQWDPLEPMFGVPGTGYGIYAMKQRSTVHNTFGNHGYVIGRVALWGDVIEHRSGYRAEYAKVVSLDHYHSADVLKALRKKYHVERPLVSIECTRCTVTAGGSGQKEDEHGT